MHTLMRFLAPLVVLAAMLNPAAAMKGCFVGGGVNGAVADVSATLVGLEQSAAQSSLGAYGAFSCYQPINANVFAGVVADGTYVFSANDTPLIIGTTGADVDRMAGVAARAGVHLSDNLALFGELGWGWAWAKDLEAGPISLDVPVLDGPRVGAGALYKIGERVMLELSYHALLPREGTIDVVPGLGIDVDPVVHNLRLGVNFAIWGADEPAPARRK
jgi:opacity protein-like surface antigen